MKAVFPMRRDRLLLFAPDGGRVDKLLGKRQLRPLLSLVLERGGGPASASWQRGGSISGAILRDCLDARLAKPRHIVLRRGNAGALVLQLELPVVDQDVYCEQLLASLSGRGFLPDLGVAGEWMRAVPQVFEAVGAGNPESSRNDEFMLQRQDLIWLNIGDHLVSPKLGSCVVVEIESGKGRVLFATAHGAQFGLQDYEFEDEGMHFFVGDD